MLGKGRISRWRGAGTLPSRSSASSAKLTGSWRRGRGRGRGAAPGDLRGHLSPLACSVRRDEADDDRRLKELETENARLMQIVAGKELEIDALREIAKRNW